MNVQPVYGAGERFHSKVFQLCRASLCSGRRKNSLKEKGPYVNGYFHFKIRLTHTVRWNEQTHQQSNVDVKWEDTRSYIQDQTKQPGKLNC